MLDEKCTMSWQYLHFSSGSHASSNQGPLSRIQDFCSIGKESPNYLDHVSEQVDKYRGQTVSLEKPAGYPMRIGGLDDTIYAEMEDELEAWEDFYLPERVEMRVVGAIDMFPSLAVGLQLIILAGKDGNIYAYENEVLHQVADSLQDLLQKGIEFPGTKVYNYGECFAPMTEEEYDELMEDEEVKKMKEETREFIKSNEVEFLSILARIEEKENAEKVASNEVVPCKENAEKVVSNEVVSCKENAEKVVSNEVVPCKENAEKVVSNEVVPCKENAEKVVSNEVVPCKENAEKVVSNEVVPSNHHRPKHVVVQMWKHADELVIFHLNDADYEILCKLFQLLRLTRKERKSNGNCRRFLLHFRALPCVHKLCS
ncbi:uncharacterized protein LOC117415485 [Acipenser ruthenus]|uniref:uncharacterized protein LOC117415485 n=1 Tax=Acipenser ruthenus TaxID=7906 RepID=UPI00274206D9|nr:uncharacterized protein LOC117415485 [Acipenser ruthenus]XP_058861814.1 uncharacterized protein LOC117415485 [Acipenser ruthenus]